MSEAVPTVGSVLGDPGAPVKCKVISEDVAVHWYPQHARPGDRCLCGAMTMKAAS